MDNKKLIYGAYEELKGVLGSIPEDRTWFDDDGFSPQVNRIIERIKTLGTEINDIDSYMITANYIQDRGNTIDVIPTRSKLNGLIGRIKGMYDFDNGIKQSGAGHTFIQQQSQNQEQYQITILDLHERIISEIQKYPEGTKERGFLDKLKKSLPSLSNTMGILSSILSIAVDSGLNIEDIKKLLGL